MQLLPKNFFYRVYLIIDCVGDQDNPECRVWSTTARWIRVPSSTFTVQKKCSTQLAWTIRNDLFANFYLPCMTKFSQVKLKPSSLQNPQLISSSTRPKLSTLKVHYFLLTVEMNLFKKCARFYTSQLRPHDHCGLISWLYQFAWWIMDNLEIFSYPRFVF